MSNKIILRKLPPVWFIRLISAFRSGLLSLHRKTFPANIVIYEKFSHFWILPSLRMAAELDIARLLEEHPMTIGQLAEKTGTNPEALMRVMRALCGEKIFRKGKNGTYKNTRLSRVLMEGKGSIRHMIIQHLSTVNWSSFNEFPYTLHTGKSAFSKVYGTTIYDYLSEHPMESALFDRSMTNLSEISVEPILSVYNFSKYPLIADIGGGEGLLLSSILFKNKGCKGILFDLPEALRNSGNIFERFGLPERITVIPGSFFEKIPAGADLYVLKNIVHNWNDDDCVKILSGIRTAMPEHGKVLILEMIIDETNRSSFAKLIDIQMMIFMENGKERSKAEFQSIIEASGLSLNRIIPTIAPISILEVTKK
jgi:hypothetical protein